MSKTMAHSLQSLLSRFRQISPDLRRALLISQALALFWWLVTLWFGPAGHITTWFDQSNTFMQLPGHLVDPYQVPRFVGVPWTGVLLLPFGWLPLSLSVLIQLCLYFAILTGVIFKLGGNTRTVLITLTSFVAFNTALEMNLDWLVCIGLLVPPALSGPFLLIKPQDALGYWLSLKRGPLVHALIVTLVVLLISFLVWGAWPLPMWRSAQTNTLGQPYNLAPLVILPVPIALAVGLFIAWRAVRRHDAVLGILAGLFFIPYITLYALLLHLALVTTRWPRFALLVSVVMWMVYGGVIARYFLQL